MKPNICPSDHQNPLRTNYGVFCMDCGYLDEFLNSNTNDRQPKNPLQTVEDLELAADED